ncbi:MAG: hypothetical protein QOH49_3925 [Acidobacteriota bacterium]|jgi:hypothetical protein|nr:hypothetical protein [Acidobacteriota bacterium]
MLNNDVQLWLKLAVMTRLDRATRFFQRRKHADQFKSVETVCLFIGYPRSGHSLVGSVVDAHPNALVSHRVDAVKYWKAGYAENEVFYLMLKNSRRFAKSGRELTGYAYPIPGRWQGDCEMLKVIGDQEARATTHLLGQDHDFLNRLLKFERARVAFVHVIRNPFDNISTWAQRSRTGLPYNVERYFELCEYVSEIKKRTPSSRMLDVRHERFISEFESGLRRVTSFLGLAECAEFTKACSSIVRTSPSLSRLSQPWTPALIDDVQKRMSRFDFLQGYSFDA